MPGTDRTRRLGVKARGCDRERIGIAGLEWSDAEWRGSVSTGAEWRGPDSQATGLDTYRTDSMGIAGEEWNGEGGTGLEWIDQERSGIAGTDTSNPTRRLAH